MLAALCSVPLPLPLPLPLQPPVPPSGRPGLAMALALQDCLPRRAGYSLLPSCLLAGAACLGTLAYLRSISSPLSTTHEPKITLSPKDTALPWLTLQETQALPYPPDPLPGRRDVGSPLGESPRPQAPLTGREILMSTRTREHPGVRVGSRRRT